MKCCVVGWTEAVVIDSGFVNVWHECSYLKCLWPRINRCVLLSLLHMFLLLHVEKNLMTIRTQNRCVLVSQCKYEFVAKVESTSSHCKFE